VTDSYKPRGFAQRVDEIEPFRVVEVLTRATELAAAEPELAVERLARVLA
jgi:hypothetical protein